MRKNRKKGAGQCLSRWYNALAFGVGKLLCRQASGPALRVRGPDARIAQLVEQRIENPRVGGSNPPPGTTYFHYVSEKLLYFLRAHRLFLLSILLVDLPWKR
jgi:hypothetical protein